MKRHTHKRVQTLLSVLRLDSGDVLRVLLTRVPFPTFTSREPLPTQTYAVALDLKKIISVDVDTICWWTHGGASFKAMGQKRGNHQYNTPALPRAASQKTVQALNSVYGKLTAGLITEGRVRYSPYYQELRLTR